MEAGYNYSTDCLPDPAVWEQMLNKSPIKHVKQVCVLSSRLCVSHSVCLLDPMQVKKALLSLYHCFSVPCVCVLTVTMYVTVVAIQVKTPVLLTLGEDDKRVPPKQGIEYYRALKALQVPVR